MPDFVVIGGGIAGVSAAAHLAPHGTVTLVETEPTLAAHTTGRSAAMFTASYGGQAARPLARASQGFLEAPPEGAADRPLLSERGAIWVAGPGDEGRLGDAIEHGRRLEARFEPVDADEVLSRVPAMRAEAVVGGLWEEDARDLDVAALHQAFVRIARAAGASILTSAPVASIERLGAGWRVTAGATTLDCDSVIDAAGAWGDVVAAMAGVPAVGLQPRRRTAFMVPGSEQWSRWPMVIDLGDRYYFKPDGVQILCSLAEEAPDDPGDPRPRPEDVALAIERINVATTLDIRSVNSEWTGLRTFAPDREMVIGEEPDAPGFFWLAGQGGTGIQTSPAYGSLLASLVVGMPLPVELAEEGFDPAATDPARFRT